MLPPSGGLCGCSCLSLVIHVGAADAIWRSLWILLPHFAGFSQCCYLCLAASVGGATSWWWCLAAIVALSSTEKWSPHPSMCVLWKWVTRRHRPLFFKPPGGDTCNGETLSMTNVSRWNFLYKLTLKSGQFCMSP